MNISVTNLQKQFRIDRNAVIRLARHLMDRASRMDLSRNWLECSVVIVGHQRMTQLNEDVLGHPGTTDVITFVYPSAPGETPGCRGEIVINMEEAAEVSARRRTDINREFALYLAHGCQHLGGADDQRKDERAAMNRRQNAWLRKMKSDGLLRGLIK